MLEFKDCGATHCYSVYTTPHFGSILGRYWDYLLYILGLFFADFRMIWGRIWIDCWINWAWFGDDLGSILDICLSTWGRLGDDLGMIWGRFWIDLGMILGRCLEVVLRQFCWNIAFKITLNTAIQIIVKVVWKFVITS